MEKLKELAINGLKILALGVLVGTGVRAAEWAIPAPEMRVVVCTMDDFDHVETCTSAAKLLKKHAGQRMNSGATRGFIRGVPWNDWLAVWFRKGNDG